MIEGQLYNLLIIQTIGPLITDVIKELIGKHQSVLTEWITVNTVIMLVIGYYSWKYKCDIKYFITDLFNRRKITYNIEGTVHYGDCEIMKLNGQNMKTIKHVMYYILNVIKPSFNKKTTMHVNIKSTDDNLQIYKIPKYFKFIYEGETMILSYYEEKNTKSITLSLSIKANSYEIIDKLLKTSNQYHTATVGNDDTVKFKNYIYMLNNQGRFINYNQYNFNNNATFDDLFLNNKDELITHLSDFKNGISKHKFLSLLLHGKPGTGKTSIIRMMAAYFNRSVVYIKLNEVNDMKTLLDIIHNKTYEISVGYDDDIKNVKISNNKIIVFEDIDACCENLIKKRGNDNTIDKEKLKKNKLPFENDDNTDTKLTLGDILNVLNGVVPNNDLIFVMTTNYVEKIDNALTRPGRITLNLCLNEINKLTICNMINKYYPNIDNSQISNDVKLQEIIPCILENIIKNTGSYDELINILNNPMRINEYNIKYEN